MRSYYIGGYKRLRLCAGRWFDRLRIFFSNGDWAARDYFLVVLLVGWAVWCEWHGRGGRMGSTVAMIRNHVTISQQILGTPGRVQVLKFGDCLDQGEKSQKLKAIFRKLQFWTAIGRQSPLSMCAKMAAKFSKRWSHTSSSAAREY